MSVTTAPLTQPFSKEKTDAILADFYRDGYVLIPGVLSADECAKGRAIMDREFEKPEHLETDNRRRDHILLRMFELDNYFRDLLVREPMIGLAEAVLGKQCHLMAQNALRTTDVAIDNFHVDDEVEFPLPDSIARHDPQLQMPVFRMTVQILLSDVPTIEHGPTQFVPTSHYSGRNPDDQKNPEFEGKQAVSMLCKAGDIYLHNGQCWHRGAPNTSGQPRYLLQNGYCRRWVAQRFWPFIHYRMPEHVLEGAGDRLRRVLGEHPKGAYG